MSWMINVMGGNVLEKNASYYDILKPIEFWSTLVFTTRFDSPLQ